MKMFLVLICCAMFGMSSPTAPSTDMVQSDFYEVIDREATDYGILYIVECTHSKRQFRVHYHEKKEIYKLDTHYGHYPFLSEAAKVGCYS